MASIRISCNLGDTGLLHLQNPIIELDSGCSSSTDSVGTIFAGNKGIPLFDPFLHKTTVDIENINLYIAVLIKDRCNALVCCLQVVAAIATHDQVIACVQVQILAAFGAPVCHNQAMEVPLIPENIDKQLRI